MAQDLTLRLARRVFDEYCDWEEYRITFSKYETDLEYVKYCDKISKKIKWVEKYLTEEYEMVPMYKNRGARQAKKIAAGFSHLPLSLATRGYDEYIWDLWYVLELKDYVCSYFEMSFEDALKQTLSENNGNEVLKLITDVVYSKSERPKMHVDYVKKKLEVAVRIGLTSGGDAVEGVVGGSSRKN
ncbi:hypothetical protein QOZ80_3AG0240050 [Eleusine coracana subsp. coracana]|nr:hypothetical protein QOZ80_3AG0240050 [Eleusine coracana subsp. coracana]